jgi:hypothetical protein
MKHSLKAQVAMMAQFTLGHIWSALNDHTVAFPVVFPKGIVDKAQDQTINPEAVMVCTPIPSSSSHACCSTGT